MCSCVAETSCDSESLGASLCSFPEPPGPCDPSAELSETQKGSGLEELPKTAGTPQERYALGASVLLLHMDYPLRLLHIHLFMHLQALMLCYSLGLCLFISAQTASMQQIVVSCIQSTPFSSRVMHIPLLLLCFSGPFFNC